MTAGAAAHHWFLRPSPWPVFTMSKLDNDLPLKTPVSVFYRGRVQRRRYTPGGLDEKLRRGLRHERERLRKRMRKLK
jgi:hypothetical protein